MDGIEMTLYRSKSNERFTRMVKSSLWILREWMADAAQKVVKAVAE